MRLLILGGTGLLGHMVWRRAYARGLDVVATVRTRPDVPGIPAGARAIDAVDVRQDGVLDRVLDRAAPDVVINAVGVTKALVPVVGEADTRRINAGFPHALASASARRGCRVIQVSTDCVFSGSRGSYTEADAPDPVDVYGQSKLDGEIADPHVLTIRTSMVGPELAGQTGLLAWFLAQRGGRVAGFTHARFSGLSTPVLADALLDEALRAPGLRGLYHLAGPPIDKCSLLRLLDDAFEAGVTIDPRVEPRIDRTLDGSRFAAATGFVPPSWRDMVSGLRAAHDARELRRVQA